MYVELKARVYTVLYTLLQYTLLIEHLSYGVKIRMLQRTGKKRKKRKILGFIPKTVEKTGILPKLLVKSKTTFLCALVHYM